VLQDETRATYEPVCDDKVAGIDWGKPGKEVFDLVRGCDPQPGAFGMLGDQRIHFYNSKLEFAQHSNSPGTIVRCDEKGLTIAVIDGLLEIVKVRPAGGAKISALDFISSAGLKVGDRF